MRKSRGIILNFDSEGNLVAIEILDASRRIPDVNRLEFRVTV